jgi:hypothetical protein
MRYLYSQRSEDDESIILHFLVLELDQLHSGSK